MSATSLFAPVRDLADHDSSEGGSDQECRDDDDDDRLLSSSRDLLTSMVHH